MADDSVAAPAASESAAPVSGPMSSVADIASFMSERRQKAAAETPEAPAANRAAPDDDTDSEPADAGDEDAGPDEAPGEADDGDEAGEPPIDPPRTWSKAEKEAFRLLPPEHQRAIADRESERDSHYQRGLQDAAAKSKAAEAERQAAEQARQQYEAALPSLYQQFQTQFASEFADIKSWDDVRTMRETDPMRFLAWQEARTKGEALRVEAAAAQQRQEHEARERWQQYVADQDARFIEKAPEFRDPKKAAELASEAKAMFSDLGFEAAELAGLWEGGKPINFRDHRVQLAFRDALRWRNAEKARKAAKPVVTPVQKPGAPTERAAVSERTLAELRNKATQTGATRDIAALLAARRKVKAS